MQPLQITRKQAEKILASTFPEYRGRKIRVIFAESLTLHDLNWSGGTRNEYAFVKASGESARLAATFAPWSNEAATLEGAKIDLPANVIAVEWSHFCGTDCGLRIIAHPSNAPKWLE